MLATSQGALQTFSKCRRTHDVMNLLQQYLQQGPDDQSFDYKDQKVQKVLFEASVINWYNTRSQMTCL